MRYSIMGFNQEKVMSTDLDLTDLIILQYIQQSCGSTNMQHKLDSNGNPRVWIYHQKLIEDLPILRISEGTLRNRLSKLNQSGYVRSTVVASENGRGSKTYYGITEMTMSLIYDMVSGPCHEKMTSDSKLIKDDNTNISNTKVLDNDKKPVKKNLYQKCADMIEEFTDDQSVRGLLDIYLRMRLEMKDKPLFANQFKGVLNKLRELTESKTEAISIIQQSIDKGYASFFPLNSYHSNQSAACEKNVNCIKMTADEEEKQNQFIEKLKSEGKQVEF